MFGPSCVKSFLWPKLIPWCAHFSVSYAVNNNVMKKGIKTSQGKGSSHCMVEMPCSVP